MALPGLRTLLARILLGFAVLILTFVVVMAVSGGNMYVLTRQIRVIPDGYLELALISKDLVGKQQSLREYVTSELAEEASERRARHRIRRLRDQRERLIGEAQATVVRLDDVPRSHRKHVRRSGSALEQIAEAIDELDPLYETLLLSPPLSTTRIEGESTIAILVEQAAARDAQKQIARQESRLLGRMHEFARRQQLLVENTALGVAKNERKVRIYGIYLGAVAVVVAILIAIWVTVTLRSLQRLQQAAKRIARGDYASRIEERGPREVADLAHEFNLMGRAIEEREREVVRNERLAAVGKMAAMITHEVRNPLSSISLNTEVLQEEISEIDPDRASGVSELCRSISVEVDRLTAMTEEYLKYARLPKPKLRLEPIEPILQSLVEFEREQLRQSNVEIACECDPGLPELMVDEAQIRQALLNLIRNAAEALGPEGGGTIVVSARDSGDDGVILEVRDDGPGIPQELADKLFDPFVSSKERGTGLGLAMAHQIALEHGGLMTVASAPRSGTTFRIELAAKVDAIRGDS